MTDVSRDREPLPMPGRRKVGGFILLFAAGCVIGAAAGGYAGFTRGRAIILNEALCRDAREVGSRISILRQLRDGAQERAVESLETGLNDLLIVFDPDTPYPGLESRTTAALKNAIDQAREYRAAYPRPADGRDFRDKMVRNLFSRDLYRQGARQ
jgi:hypothetical protein